MALTAVWVGGSVARPGQYGPGYLELVYGHPWSDITGYYDPFTTAIMFRGNGSTNNWFSIPISTPVILNDKRAKLKRVFVLWQADKNVEFYKVSLFDGPSKIWEQSVSLLGPLSFHNAIVMGKNAWDIVPSISMWSGLTILVDINFINSGHITFTTAGADFDV
jgi:hypothetical protein